MKSTELKHLCDRWHCDDTVWACAFRYDKTRARLILQQKPIKGRLLYGRYPDSDPGHGMAPRYFVPFGTNGPMWSKVVAVDSRDYADTQQEAVELYNQRILENIDWFQTRIQSLHTMLLDPLNP